MKKLFSIHSYVNIYLFSTFFQKILPGGKVWDIPQCLHRDSVPLRNLKSIVRLI